MSYFNNEGFFTCPNCNKSNISISKENFKEYMEGNPKFPEGAHPKYCMICGDNIEEHFMTILAGL